MQHNKHDSKTEICYGQSGKHCGKSRKCWLPAFSPFFTFLQMALKKKKGKKYPVNFCQTTIQNESISRLQNKFHSNIEIFFKGWETMEKRQKVFFLRALNPFPKKPWFVRVCSTSLLNTEGKGEIAHNEQFHLFPQCFLPVRKTFCHFHQILNCHLQTLSVLKSLKFIILERVKSRGLW